MDREWHTSVIYRAAIYVIGGSTIEGPYRRKAWQNSVYRFDIQAGLFDRKP